MKLVVKVLLKVIMQLITILLYPIDLLISTYLPSISNALSAVNNFLGWLTTFAQWVLSWLPFDTTFYAFLIGVLVFRFTFPLLIDTVKIAIKWYHYLAP